MSRNLSRSGLQASQRGAVLIVGLILLMIMTILGLASMSDTGLQERMAGSFWQKNKSNQAAEFALREAEAWLGNNANMQYESDLNAFDGVHTNATDGGLYSLVAVPTAKLLANGSTLDVNSHSDWSSNGALAVSQTIDGVSTQPRYIIEYMGRGLGPDGDAGGAGLNPNDEDALDLRTHVFRITAVGWGNDLGARSIMQSFYRLSLVPGNRP